MTIEEAKQRANEALSARRFEHEKNVAAAARTLAERFGEDPDRAELAAWLHDIVKEQPKERLLQMAGQDAIMAQSLSGRPFPVWHGPCAAVYAKHQLGVQDEGVLSAIGCHTTGKRGMAKLDKILFVADMISAERNFEGVEELRRLAKEDLDAAVLATMQHSVAYVQQRGKPLDEESLAVLREMETAAAGKKDAGGNKV